MVNYNTAIVVVAIFMRNYRNWINCYDIVQKIILFRNSNMNKILASRFGLTFISGKSAEIFPFFVCFNKRGLGAVQLFPQPSFPYNFCLWPRTKHARTAASKWSQNLNFFGLFKRSWMNNESTNWPFEKLEKTFPRKTVSFLTPW